ncbi:hypothetical protein NQ318_008751 [Aromia moschata]|uniref:Transposase n=1 Tax=Aromia moschata TaxID=1265417 RepID=A0AAV8Z9Q3_9CUCU|nr:hypothetical protein NQ318_008751 [Aromia moschata]
MKRRVNRVRPDISKSWKFHHDNAPSHSDNAPAFFVADYLVKAGITVVPQPPYSPDLAPLDFFLFPRLKTPMKPQGQHFGSVKNIQKACTDALKANPENDYRAAFDALLQIELTEYSEAEVEGDHDDVSVGGQHAAVVGVAGTPLEALPVDEHEHRIRGLQASVPWNRERERRTLFTSDDEIYFFNHERR